ncbi:unnamed protein product [Adineta ricciae]|uniref:Saccharopine dehydrogenase n=1 Tax=Adineta ricciae TaxID=249248 RepID=A0A813YUS6_ADIRI|nr:unnamed protein product [Adineta ricciae]CAF0889446.1 unnamed protein product [Adineta ricciae]
MKILLIGGYGTFGSRLCQLLSNKSQLTLLIAGRSLKNAEKFCRDQTNSLAKLIPFYFDRNQLDVETRLRSIQPNLVIDTAGPFQSYGNDPYRIVKACLATSTNYLDLADSSQFVRDIKQFDEQAKSKNIYVLSGVSTVPLLTAVVARHLAKGLFKVHSIKGGIAPSPHINIGLNVIQAITGYAGQRIPVVRQGQLTSSYGLTETMHYTISPPGYLPIRNRRFALVDVPDYYILRDVWPDIDSIWIGASTEPEILHRLLTSLAWLVRWRLISSLQPLAPAFHRAIQIVRWGEHRGGMFVSIEGVDRQGQKHERSWHLIADDDRGPFIPVMGIGVLISQTLDGRKLKSGARAAVPDLDLEDYENLFRHYHIITGQRTSTNFDSVSMTLYQKLLDQAWYELPESIRKMHSFKSTTKVAGIAKVDRGTSMMSRLIAMIVGFPDAGQDIPVEVVFRPDSSGELWTRTFAGKSFSSWQAVGHSRSDKLLDERFGPFTFGLALVIQPKQLHLVVRNWSFLGIPLPSILAPNGDSYEYDDNGQFYFHVEIKHKFTGLIVRYHGWLKPVDGN